MIQKLWLEIFSLPWKDRLMIRKQLPKKLARKNKEWKSIIIHINNRYLYIEWQDIRLSYSLMLEALTQLPWSVSMVLFPCFSRPLQSYYAQSNQKEITIKYLRDIPFKPTKKIDNIKELELNKKIDNIKELELNKKIDNIKELDILKKSFVANSNPDLKLIRLDKLRLLGHMPVELYQEFFENNYCLFTGFGLIYVGQKQLDNSKAVAFHLNLHLDDLHNKVKRDINSYEINIKLGDKQKNILDKLSSHMDFNKTIVSSILIGRLADRSSEIVSNFTKLSGLVSGLKNKDIMPYITNMWNRRIGEVNSDMAIFIEDLIYTQKAAYQNKLPTGRGDPLGVKKSIRLLCEIMEKYQLDPNIFFSDRGILRLIAIYFERHKPGSKDFKLKYAVSCEPEQLCLKNYMILKKLYHSTEDGDQECARSIDLENSLATMNQKNMKEISNQLIQFKNKNKINHSSCRRALIGRYLEIMHIYIKENVLL